MFISMAAGAASWAASVALTLLLAAPSLFDLRHAAAAYEPHLVRHLPGLPTPIAGDFPPQYAGYITVNQARGHELFYWFFQSPLPNAPLALWLNGGPGCSSVGNGALSEMGPFFPNATGDGLLYNKHTWIRAANIIFLESPYGTGFSFSRDKDDDSTYTDSGVAKDAYNFLVEWFKRYPEYKHTDFYLVGESYAGHYIPTLAQVIVAKNKSPQGFKINFKGFAIGNPWTNAYYDNLGTTEFYYSHSFISKETYDTLYKNCEFKTDLPVDAGSSNPLCNKAIDKANKDMEKIDIYNVYGLSCNEEGNSSSQYQRLYNHRATLVGAYVDPCLDSVTPYLNLPEVQRALHVPDQVSWKGCSNVVFGNYSRQDFVSSMLPIYKELLKEKLKIWIYSGDCDGVVATLGTRQWIKSLNLTIEDPWHAWNYKNQVGGWTETYKGLTFVTVRGAGHLVPSTKPGPAFALFKTFLSNKGLAKF